jgi:predicted nucleic-acid-binding protein
MIALDTNVVVRYLVEDDKDQAERAARMIESALAADEPLFVPQVVLCEVVWVLDSVYQFPREDILSALKGLIQARQLLVQGKDEVRRAIEALEAGKGDFSDYIIRENSASAGCDRVATFDRPLLRESGFVAP